MLTLHAGHVWAALAARCVCRSFSTWFLGSRWSGYHTCSSAPRSRSESLGGSGSFSVSGESATGATVSGLRPLNLGPCSRNSASLSVVHGLQLPAPAKAHFSDAHQREDEALGTADIVSQMIHVLGEKHYSLRPEKLWSGCKDQALGFLADIQRGKL